MGILELLRGILGLLRGILGLLGGMLGVWTEAQMLLDSYAAKAVQ